MCATCPKAWPSWYEAWILYFVSNTVLHLNTCQVRSKLLLCTGHWKGEITVKKKIIKAITSEGLIHTSWHMSHYLTSHFSCSHAHFRRSPVIDPLKKRRKKKKIVRIPIRTLVRLKCSSGIPFTSHWFYGAEDKPAIISPTKFKPLFSAKDRCVHQCIQTTQATCFGWSK